VTSEEKKTPLYNWHMDKGANMALFGSYMMPLWYPAGVKAEHLSVITHAGIFDTSHMSVLTVTGPGTFDLLQKCFSKDLRFCVGPNHAPISPNKSVYGVFLNDKGGVIDDAIVSQVAENHYTIVVNAGMGDAVRRHLAAQDENKNVTIADLTDQYGKMDVQGPKSAKILTRVIKNADTLFERFPYFSFKGYFEKGVSSIEPVELTDGTPVLISRTGYTGEFGFELFTGKDHTEKMWDMILEAGEPMGLVPCGLAARDSLRTGALLPLSHQDIGPWPFINTPWHFALPYSGNHSNFTKNFIGDQALLSIDTPDFTYAFVGFDPRKIATENAKVYLDSNENEPIGTVLTCATDMALGRYGERVFSIASPNRPLSNPPKGLSCGFIKVKKSLPYGQNLIIKDNRRKIKAVVVNDIRPDRTARRPAKEMLSSEEEAS
jgi:glycine cleavage system T protein (aminomethyltransferase)